MKRQEIGSIIVFFLLLAGCISDPNDPSVSRIWEMQEKGHYVFETNTPTHAGMISSKGWSGFIPSPGSLALEYTIHSGGKGLLYGIKIETAEKTDLPLFVVDHKGRYNFLDPDSFRPLNKKWESGEKTTPGTPVILRAERMEDAWHFSLGEIEAGTFACEKDEARFGAVVFTTYGSDHGSSTDFPKKKIFLEMKVIEER
jgi:hypothetical protein